MNENDLFIINQDKQTIIIHVDSIDYVQLEIKGKYQLFLNGTHSLDFDFTLSYFSTENNSFYIYFQTGKIEFLLGLAEQLKVATKTKNRNKRSKYSNRDYFWLTVKQIND
ncbi:hypothetical protein KAI92_02580 [Candidatus Parcubacteria bacterium]|nr:hypothetical protein [Candidatus Parcubacteria bacterium]